MPLRRLSHALLFWSLVALILTFALFPVYYTVITSFSDDQGQFQVHYLPQHLSLVNYRQILSQHNFLRAMLNSAVIGAVSVCLALLVGLLASYALARIAFRGRGLLLMTILSVSIFPQIAILAGLYELMRALGLYNSLWALVVSQVVFTLPFTVWLLTTFMRQLPVEIEEAAILDGATPLGLVRHIFLPLLTPALVTTSILAFIGAFNEFLFALTFIINENLRTVPLAMSMISGQVEHQAPWGPIMAASVIVTTPLVGLVLVLQRRIVAGLTAGALAG